MADPGTRPLGQAERVLELGAACEYGPSRAWRGKRDGPRDVSARAPENRLPTIRRRAHDRVVGARLDRPVVDEEQVRDVLQALERVLVSVGGRVCGRGRAGRYRGSR